MQRYDPKTIEPRWQKKWEDDGTYQADLTDTTRPKYFGFSMLPGITGSGIHIGHGRTFQFSDIKVRAKRQQGYNAYHPIGWDSFGLPVENYAIKIGKQPRIAHDEAKVNFKNQLKRLGYSYDWSKEISTADPSYYKWTQWIFNKLLEHGLAYQKESPQWWCETDQTVLANEQVEAGKCWRCGNIVTKKNLKQWFFKITDYADDILEATKGLNWTEMVKTMQENWIGKSQGARVEFQIDGSKDAIAVFTTRVDTLAGATFLAVAPEHPLVNALAAAEQKEAVESYVESSKQKSDIERQDAGREKTGTATGSYAINPLTGEKMPIWVADYVLAGYGTGAIMAVPAHDERDNQFARAFDLPIREVIQPSFIDTDNPPKSDAKNTTRNTILCIIKNPADGKYLTLRWRKHDWHTFVTGGVEDDEDTVEAARREITEETGYKNLKFVARMPVSINSLFYAAHKDVNRDITVNVLSFELENEDTAELKRDEIEDFDVKWVSRSALSSLKPVTGLDLILQWLEYGDFIHPAEGRLVNSGVFDGMNTEEAREKITAWLEGQGQGKSVTNYKMHDWLISRQRYWGAPIPIIHCEEHGAVPVPDDDLPVILPEVENYKPTGGNTSVLAQVEDWVSTTCPMCGRAAKRETDTLDGYACSSWYFLRYLDPFNEQQAWDPEVINRWMPVDFYNGADHAVAHLLYARFWMRFFYKIGLVNNPEPFNNMMYNAYIMASDGRKMSKSLGNVIDPLEIMDSGYGADALRVYEMFIAPYDAEAPWDPRGVPGTYRFLNRTWNLAQEYIEAPDTVLSEEAEQKILKIAHKTAKKVTSDIEHNKFNTAVSTMMEAVNGYFLLKQEFGIGKHPAWQFAIESLLQVLSPFAPHITEELWQQMGHDATIHKDSWPEWDEAYLTQETVTVPIQVNGKVRASLEVAKDITEKDVVALAKSNEKIAPYLKNKELKKTIYIPGRIVNLVLL